MTIPFLDLARLHGSIRAELDAAWARTVETSAFIGGTAVAGFEEAFAAASGLTAAAGCGSGTDALVLALVAAGIGPGDEVVVPAFTFVATAEAVVHAGATPVLADVDPTTLLLTPEAVDAVRTPHTRAVVPVHLFGHVAPLEHLDAWRAEGLVVVEDVAQAHLATWRGRPVGTAGDVSCFSFYPGKNLGALGDGGLVGGDDDLVERVKVLRDHGSRTKYEHAEIGWCSRLDGLQAALLAVKLAHLPTWTASRAALADRYAQVLPEDLLVPWEEGAVHHLLVVRVPAERRVDIRAGMLDRGVETGIHYPVAVSDQPAMRPHRRPCPEAELAASEVLSLPMDPLMTPDEVDQVAGILGEVLGRT